MPAAGYRMSCPSPARPPLRPGGTYGFRETQDPAAAKPHSRTTKAPMNVETLERRRLLSVGVVEGYPGYYEVYGDDSANFISISIDNANSTFTLDGTEYGGVSYVSVFAQD